MNIKFNKKTSLVFVVLGLVIFIGFVLYNKKVEGMKNAKSKSKSKSKSKCNPDIDREIRHAMNLVNEGNPKTKNAFTKLLTNKRYSDYLKTDGNFTPDGIKCMNKSMVK